jgi:hypothetical protein
MLYVQNIIDDHEVSEHFLESVDEECKKDTPKEDERIKDSRILRIIAGITAHTNEKSGLCKSLQSICKPDIVSTAPITRTNAGRESMITSLNIRDKISQLLSVLTNQDTTNSSKIQVSDMLCNKLYGMYLLTTEKRQIVIEELSNAVYKGEDIPIPYRLYFLRFRDEKTTYNSCLNLFRRRVGEKMQGTPYFQILKYILRGSIEVYRPEVATDVIDQIEGIFTHPETSIYTKMEIADILLLNGREQRGEEMLAEIRELERQQAEERERRRALMMVNAQPRIYPLNRNTIYDDSQNVHDHVVNQSVLHVCLRLMELYQPDGYVLGEVEAQLHSICNEQERENINTVLQRIEIDTSMFNTTGTMFGLYDVFSSLWKYIQSHSAKEDLLKRLVEEMVAMANYCSTGHLSRFVNVIQGFTDDEMLQIRISNEQQIRAVITQYLDTVLMNAPEDVTDAMMETDKTPFYDFIRDTMNKRIPSLMEEYGSDIGKYIVLSIEKYSSHKGWSITDNILSYTT